MTATESKPPTPRTKSRWRDSRLIEALVGAVIIAVLTAVLAVVVSNVSVGLVAQHEANVQDSVQRVVDSIEEVRVDDTVGVEPLLVKAGVDHWSNPPPRSVEITVDGSTVFAKIAFREELTIQPRPDDSYLVTISNNGTSVQYDSSTGEFADVSNQ